VGWTRSRQQKYGDPLLEGLFLLRTSLACVDGSLQSLIGVGLDAS
jgi:hypothetical protein